MHDNTTLEIEHADHVLNNSTYVISDIVEIIEKAHAHVAREYNTTHVLLCWLIGRRIDQEILKSERAEYGENVVISLSNHLSMKYGKGYSRPHIFRMIKFAKLFPDQDIVSTLSRQLSWSHFILICALDDGVKRQFYAEMNRVQNWSVRELKKQIDSQLFERTALSKKDDHVIENQLKTLRQDGHMTTEMVFKDPYFINFIGGQDSLSEADLENLILTNITEFLTELGSDFCFVARQKRMSTAKKDRYLDLLFFHRRLRRLIAIDLKIGDFEPSYKGQMEWYLNWLDKHERLPHEEKPIGIILCAGKDDEDIEYLEMDTTGIHVAQYITELPPKQILEEKLKRAISLAKENQAKGSLASYSK
jgi:predicted nuclease of restriction endonuclease-like (RecB) superfamily